MRGERYIQIPGRQTHELPPLHVRLTEHAAGHEKPYLDSVMLEAVLRGARRGPG